MQTLWDWTSLIHADPLFLSSSVVFVSPARQLSTMNPMNGSSAAASQWQEARNADGRAYYYNVQTKATQWAKPDELMTPVEVCISPNGLFL